MKNATKTDGLPSMISDVIDDSKQYIDNLFADTWKQFKLNSLIRAAGFTKRSGIGIAEAVLLLLVWKWLNTVINRDVFQAGPDNILRRQKRCHVRFTPTGRDQLACAKWPDGQGGVSTAHADRKSY